METTHEPFDQPVLEADKVGLGDFSQSFTDDGWDKLYGTITIEDEFDKRPTSPVNFSSGREDVMSSNFNYVAEPPREVEQRLHSPYQNNFLANHQQSFTQVSRQALDGPSFSQSLVSRPRSTTDMHHPQTFPKIQHSNILKNNNHYGINASQKNGGFSDFKTDNGQRQMQMRQGIQMEGLANHNNYVNLKVLQNKSELYKGNGLSKQAHSNLPNHLEMNAQSVSNSRSIPNMMSYKQGQAYHGGGITSASNSEIQKNIGPSDYRSTINGINVNHLNLQNIQNPNLNSINTPVNTNPQQFLSTGNSQRLAIHSIGNEKSSSANNIHPRAPSNLQQPLNQAHLHQLQINHQRRIQNRTPSVFPVNPPQGQNPFLSYCYLVNVSFPAIGMHISPDRVAMLLKRTHDVFAKTSFVWARLQQPKHGECFMLARRDVTLISPDGYVWPHASSNPPMREVFNVGGLPVEVTKFTSPAALMIRLEYRLAIPNSFLIFIHYLSINPVFNHAVNPRANIPQVPSQGSGLNPESVEKSEMNSTMNLTNIPNRSGPIRVPPVEGPKKSTIPAQASGIVNNVTRIGPGRPSIVKRGVIGSNQMLTKRSSRPPEDSDLHINSRKATQKNDQQQAKIFSVSNQQKSSTAEEQQQQQRLQNVFDLVRDSNRDFPKEMDHILCRIVARQSAVESIFLGLDSFDMNQIFENKGAVTRKENEDDLFSLDEKVLSNLQDEVNRLKKILEQRRIRGKEKSLRWKKILDNLAGSQISTEDLRTTEQWAQELDNFGSVSSTDGLSPT